jgi:hypothetical protein
MSCRKPNYQATVAFCDQIVKSAKLLTGCMIERILPKHIHAVTAACFELKVALFVLACSVGYLG